MVLAESEEGMKNKKWKWILYGFGLFALAIGGIAAAFLTIQIIKAPNLSEIDASPEGYLSTLLDMDGWSIFRD